MDVGALLSSGPADLGLTPLLAGLWGDHTAALPHWFAQESQLRAHYSECAILPSSLFTCVRILYNARCIAMALSGQWRCRSADRSRCLRRLILCMWLALTANVPW